jgi:hypothetical protein
MQQGVADCTKAHHREHTRRQLPVNQSGKNVNAYDGSIGGENKVWRVRTYHHQTIAKHVDSIGLDVLHTIGKVRHVLEDQQAILTDKEREQQRYTMMS